MNSSVQRRIDIPPPARQASFLKEFTWCDSPEAGGSATAGAPDRLDIFGTKGESIVVISS
jgi:hypothetical protein